MDRFPLSLRSRRALHMQARPSSLCSWCARRAAAVRQGGAVRRLEAAVEASQHEVPHVVVCWQSYETTGWTDSP
eukprot:4992882-Prymnesium_polylepis.1